MPKLATGRLRYCGPCCSAGDVVLDVGQVYSVLALDMPYDDVALAGDTKEGVWGWLTTALVVER